MTNYQKPEIGYMFFNQVLPPGKEVPTLPHSPTCDSKRGKVIQWGDECVLQCLACHMRGVIIDGPAFQSGS